MTDREIPYGSFDDILVVDDTLENLKLLTDILREAGYKVRSASDGELALRSVNAKPPALILLDIRMQGISGFDVCRHLKASADTCEIPVIFISALNSIKDKIKALNMGGADYITKPIEAEEVLARVRTHLSLYAMRADLENMVAERTLELEHANTALSKEIQERKRMEKELINIQKMKAVGQLTGGIAHEFNNLLQTIMGNLELLRDHSGNQAETAELIDNAIVASERGGELTQHLLSFSGKQTLSPKLININDTLLGIFRILQRTLGENIPLKTDLGDDLSTVNIDPGSFERALINLILNARLAMPRGGAILIETANVRLHKAIPLEDGDLPVGKYVTMTVSDTGSGMSAEVLAHAFEPFYTTRAVGEGTGLGLSIVYGFIRQSGGVTTIDSESGKGVTITMYLPVAEIDTSKKSVEPENGETEIAGNATILVVEDDPQVSEAISRFLEQIGYDVLRAANGGYALEMLKKHGEVDLVISDIMMPIMSGIEFAEKALRLYRNHKFLMISGSPRSTLDKGGIHEDRFNFLQKPFNNNQLAASVKAAINERVER